jgi:hypothetical protein
MTTGSIGSPSQLQVVRCVTFLPNLIAAGVGYHNYYHKKRHHHISPQWMIPWTMVVTVLCAQLPYAVATGLAMAAVIVFGWTTAPLTADLTNAAVTAVTTTNYRSSSITTAQASAAPPATASRGGSSASSSSPPVALAAAASSTTTATTTEFVTMFVAVIIMIVVLLTENFLIWVVSATFPAGQSFATEPPPLQDNGQYLVQSIVFAGLTKAEVVGLRRSWNAQWTLVACLAAALYCVQIQHQRRQLQPQRRRRVGRTLFGVATRAVTTIAIARTIRTVSFCLTVLPSQVQNCYAQRFPPLVPSLRNDTVAWLLVGVQPRSHGGCNDLIVSGHAVITSTLACVAVSVTNQVVFGVALWTMVVLDYAVEIYEGFHYSVDMWLGLVLVVLLWRVLRPLEGGVVDDGNDDDGDAAREEVEARKHVTSDVGFTDQPSSFLSSTVGLPNIQLNFLPEATANFTIVGFVIASMLVYVVFGAPRRSEGQRQQQRQFVMHYIQHMGLCLLVLALGVYL